MTGFAVDLQIVRMVLMKRQRYAPHTFVQSQLSVAITELVFRVLPVVMVNEIAWTVRMKGQKCVAT